MERVKEFDLTGTRVRNVNNFLHHELPSSGVQRVEILNPDGMHSIAVGLDCPVDVHIRGHAGYFIAGMNKQASVTIHGNVGWSVAENMMSGRVHVHGHASESAG
ncbi:MAG: protein glxC, partial [Planctomycetes bacterium]|nr:protein glxC [Planctomycetota bacterium]